MIGERRNLRLMTGAVLLSSLGDFLAMVPLALHLEERTGSAFAVAALFMALWLPSVVLAGPAGLLVDRVSPRAVLIWSSVLQAVVAVAAAFAHSTGAVLALAVLLGAGSAVSQPAEFTLLPRYVGGSLARANARVETARYVGLGVGPLLGGLLAAGGTMVPLLADAATFLVVAAAGLLLRAVPGSEPPSAPAHAADRARTGFTVLLRDRVLRSVLPVSVLALVFMTTIWAAEVFFVKDELGAGGAGYGVIMATWMVAMAVGATTLAVRVPAHAMALVALVSVGVQGLGVGLPAAWPVFAFAVVAAVLGGAAHGVKNVVLRTLVHERTPPHLHGRAFAAYNALRNGAELIALVGGGLLVAGIGARATLVVAGGVPLLLAVGALVRVRARRALRLRPALARAL
jgi:MFS family permease